MKKNTQRFFSLSIEKGPQIYLLVVSVTGLLYLALAGQLGIHAHIDAVIPLTAATYIALCLGVYLHLTKRLTPGRTALLMLLVMYLLFLCYTLKNGIDWRQHDVYEIDENGHLGYIYHLYSNLALPDTNTNQFYHPPLHHAIGALLLKLNGLLGHTLDSGLQSLRFLPLTYITLAAISGYRVLKAFGLSEKAMLPAFTLLCFHPTFKLLASSINNDALCYFLTIHAFYRAILWYKKSTMCNIAALAVALALAMLAKLSAVLLAVPIGVLFLVRLLARSKGIRSGMSFTALVKQYAVFGVLSIPLGLCHSIRNLIVLGQPLGYVVNPNAYAQYVGDVRMRYRFLAPFSENLFTNTYCSIPFDYNIYEYILRCSLFGEFSYDNVDTLARVLTVLNAVLILASVAAAVVAIVTRLKKTHAGVLLSALLLFTATLLVSYLSFNIRFPFACTMDFRYLLPTVLTGCVLLGLLYDMLGEKQSGVRRAAQAALHVLVLAFSFFSALFYLAAV